MVLEPGTVGAMLRHQATSFKEVNSTQWEEIELLRTGAIEVKGAYGRLVADRNAEVIRPGSLIWGSAEIFQLRKSL